MLPMVLTTTKWFRRRGEGGSHKIELKKVGGEERRGEERMLFEERMLSFFC